MLHKNTNSDGYKILAGDNDITLFLVTEAYTYELFSNRGNVRAFNHDDNATVIIHFPHECSPEVKKPFLDVSTVALRTDNYIAI